MVLREHNQYDQYGSYFVSLHKCIEDAVSPIGHFGRENKEDVWYKVVEVEFGVNYEDE